MIFRRSKFFFHQKGYILEKERGLSLSQPWSWFQNRRNLFSGHQVISNLTLVFTVVLKREKFK